MPMSKSAKDSSNKNIHGMDDVKKEAKTYIEKILGDVSKASATKQLVLGASSGWLTGFLAMRVGRTAALAVGGGIIILQIANQKGYVKINWDKVNKNLDDLADKAEEHVTGHKANFMDKVERYVDRKLDKAQDTLQSKQVKAKRWYSKILGDSSCQLQEVHIFLVSFAAGLAIGIGTS